MTSLEHLSVKHALDRLPSWHGNVHVDGAGNQDSNVVRVEGGVSDEVRGEEREGEEVGVGVAMTTTDDEGEALAGITVEPSSPRAMNKEENAEDDEESRGSGTTSTGTSRRSLRGTSHLGSVSGSPSRSRSPSDSNSRSQSRSRSRSSMRGPLEMGESSAATSWTQADAEGLVGERPGGDGESEQPAYDVVGCQSSVDRLELEEVIDGRAGEEAEAPKDGTEAMSLPHLRTSTDVKGEGGSSRKEEVLVMQEGDIGEVWHPLQHNGKARSQEDGDSDSEGEKGEVEEDVGSARVLESEHGGDPSLEMNEKDRWRTFGSSGSSGSRRNARPSRLEFKSSTPQPWEDIEPPTDNTYTSDYYSTLNSKKYGTLQKSRRRPFIPRSSYYFGPPPHDSAYGTPPVGQIGVHHPREIVRIERDYAGGELTQFSPVFPLELEGRITPTQFHQTINDINEILISAHNIRHAFVYNCLTILTLQLSSFFMTPHYTKEMRRLKQKIEELNTQLYNPVGLNILWPEKIAFLFLEIEYY